MITKKNVFSGAGFDYANQAGTCTASGEYRKENGQFVAISINGTYDNHGFYASRDKDGNINISGVASEVLASVAAEVVNIVTEVIAAEENE